MSAVATGRREVVIMDADVVDRRALMLGVADVMVLRVLERAGHRHMRSNRSTHGIADPHEVHVEVRGIDPDEAARALGHAWDRLTEYTTTYGCCGAEAPRIEAVLDAYVIGLLTAGDRHSTPRLAAALATGYPDVFAGLEVD